MNKLTLGQLIDTMKIGDIARSNRKVTDIIGYYFVERDGTGFYVWNGNDIEDYQNYHQMKLEKCFTLFEYEILPKYVSFESALSELVNNGKTIKSYIDGSNYDKYETIYDLYKLDQEEIKEMQWIVEEIHKI